MCKQRLPELVGDQTLFPWSSLSLLMTGVTTTCLEKISALNSKAHCCCLFPVNWFKDHGVLLQTSRETGAVLSAEQQELWVCRLLHEACPSKLILTDYGGAQ